VVASRFDKGQGLPAEQLNVVFFAIMSGILYACLPGVDFLAMT